MRANPLDEQRAKRLTRLERPLEREQQRIARGTREVSSRGEWSAAGARASVATLARIAPVRGSVSTTIRMAQDDGGLVSGIQNIQ